MNALHPHIAGMPDTNVPAVLYSLLQNQNPELTLPLSEVSFGAPQLNTQAQSLANGNTIAHTEFSAPHHGAPVTISYNQVVLADQLVEPSVNVGGHWASNAVPVFNAPPGAYLSTNDFVQALAAAGYPMTTGDIVNEPLQDFWTAQYSSRYYQSLGYQLLTWNAACLGYTGCVFVAYGPATPAPLSEAFPVSTWSPAQPGDAAPSLATYNAAYLSQQQSSEGFGAQLDRSNTTYSALTVLDPTTSQANGNAEVSAVVTYAANPNYLPTSYSQTPFWPFYAGSQTVYYTRHAASDISSILANANGSGYSYNFYGVSPFLVNGVFNIPLGAQLGSTITDTRTLVDYLTRAGWNAGFDYTDFSNAPLPGYGQDGTVVVNLMFQDSYMVKDGPLPLTLTQTGPDMTVVTDGITDFPASTFASLWGILLANTDGADALGAAVWNWYCDNYYTNVQGYDQDEASNWMWSCVASVVDGSVQTTTPDVASAHNQCGYQATIQVLTPWGTSFQFPIYFDKINLTTLAALFGIFSPPGTLNLLTPSTVFAVPMRKIDWLLNGALVSPKDARSGVSLLRYLNYRELANLNDLVLLDDEGNLSFTIRAPENSNLMEGTLQIVIANGTTLAASETSMLSDSGGVSWIHVVAA